MVMYPLKIAFSGYSIIGLSMLVLAGSMAFYMLFTSSKSRTTWLLIGFFSMVALSGMAMILTNAIIYYYRLFAPWQDFWILAGGVVLARLAYSLPQPDRSLEARIVIGLVSFLAILALAYCIIFDYRYLFQWTPGLSVSDAYYLLLPIGTLLIVVVFLRRSMFVSVRHAADLEQVEHKLDWHHLLDPKGEDARLYRNMALALSLAFLPGTQTLIRIPGIIGFILSNIGSLLAITTVALVYFNYTPEMNGFIPKLVGITLATITLVFTFVGAVDVLMTQSHMSREQVEVIASIHDGLVKKGELTNAPLHVAYVAAWEAASPEHEASYRLLYLSPEESGFGITRLIADNQKGYLDEWSFPDNVLPNVTIRIMTRFWTYPLGSGQPDYWGYVFVHEGMAYEIGFSKAAFDNAISAVVTKWLVVLLISCIFVITVFPFFFRRILVEPLENLLEGVRRVDQGEFDTVIEPSFNDEIGFLTHSFNRMVSSLDDAAEIIQNRALDLEAEVSQRTIDLVQMNVQLENENKNRQMAESRLNKQLLYQRALAGCSQSLLVESENERKQQEVLNQALEHLRSGAQVSRAYIFHKFDDPELGPCIGMKAEVCAPGVPPHINNPVNRRFPLSQFPSDLMSVLLNGNPYGGPVKEIFTGTLVLKEALLNQRPPLLSVMFFPLFDRNQLWGFIGFDDCSTEREWDEQEISMLRTASEMIGNTLQRWETETRLRVALDELEARIEERTAELNRSNIKLNEEVQQRQLAQKDLESRLRLEQTLAAVSARLLESSGLRQNIAVSLEDLGRMMDAGRVFLVEIDRQSASPVRDFFEWHKSGMQPISEEALGRFMEAFSELGTQLEEGKTIYFEDIAQIPLSRAVDVDLLRSLGTQSVVLSPLTFDQSLHGVLGCSNLPITSDLVQRNMYILEVVASMLKSLLQREYLIQSLEAQVAERTRQLTTFLDMAMLSNQAQDLTELLQPTLLAIIQIAGCDACGIHISDDNKAGLKLIADRGIPQEFLPSLREVKIETEFASWLEETDLRAASDSMEDRPVFSEPFRIPGFEVFFAIRIGTGNQPRGLLSCYRIEDQPFTPFQATLLSALGDLLGIIVENYRLRSEGEEVAVVEERQRLEREIHDAVSQSVYSLSLFARSAKDALSEDNDAKLLANLQDIETTALQSMREMRLLLYQPREFQPDEELAAALNTRFKQVENRLGIQATSEIEENLVLPTQVRYQVWRILIEVLNNVVKHASASQVQVSIARQDECLFVSVRDDGIGFEFENRSPGMGLKNIQTRVDMLGGDLKFISKPGQGTEIRLRVPLASFEREGGQ